MKKNIVGLMSLLTLLIITPSVLAAPAPLREERREMIRNTASSPGVAVRLRTKVALIEATVTAKQTDSLTVSGKDGKTYTVKFDAQTQWRRKFWGKSDVAETSVGDELNIHGKWNNDDETEIQAKLIRNISVQKRNGVFFGEVKTLSSSGWVMKTSKRGDQTVTIGGSTRLIDRKEGSLSQSAITVGARVRVKGLWDSKNNTITEVVEVKDFDLPQRITPTQKP